MPNNSLPQKNIRSICIAQRFLIAGFAASVLGLYPPLRLATIPFLLFCVWRVTGVLQMRPTYRVLSVLFSLVPVLGTVTVLVLNAKAIKALKAAGVNIGAFGARSADIPRLPATQRRAALDGLLLQAGIQASLIPKGTRKAADIDRARELAVAMVDQAANANGTSFPLDAHRSAYLAFAVIVAWALFHSIEECAPRPEEMLALLAGVYDRAKISELVNAGLSNKGVEYSENKAAELAGIFSVWLSLSTVEWAAHVTFVTRAILEEDTRNAALDEFERLVISHVL